MINEDTDAVQMEVENTISSTSNISNESSPNLTMNTKTVFSTSSFDLSWVNSDLFIEWSDELLRMADEFSVSIKNCTVEDKQIPKTKKQKNVITSTDAIRNDILLKVWKLKMIANEELLTATLLKMKIDSGTPLIKSFLVLHDLYSMACKYPIFSHYIDQLFEKTSAKMAQVISLVQDFEGGMNAWGVLISEHCLRKSGAEADRLCQLACEKFEKTLQIIESKKNRTNLLWTNDATQDACYAHWGYLLLEMGKKKAY